MCPLFPDLEPRQHTITSPFLIADKLTGLPQSSQFLARFGFDGVFPPASSTTSATKAAHIEEDPLRNDPPIRDSASLEILVFKKESSFFKKLEKKGAACSGLIKRKRRIRINRILFGPSLLIFGLKSAGPDSNRAIVIMITIGYDSYIMRAFFSIFITGYDSKTPINFNRSYYRKLLHSGLLSRNRRNDTIFLSSSFIRFLVSLCERKERNNCKNKIGGIHII
jgi:hypothetical protein